MEQNIISSILHDEEVSQEKILEYFKTTDNEYITNFSSERFLTRDLGITRKELSCWYRDGLSPYKLEEGGWKRYSLIDCIWWRFVAKLKRFGTSTKRIIEIKDLLFPRTKSELLSIFKEFDTTKVKSNNTREIITEFQNGIKNADDTFVEEHLHKIGFSLFGLYIMTISLFHHNILFFETEDGDCGFVNISDPQHEQHFQKVKELYTDLVSKNYLTINLSALVYDFFNTEKIQLDNNFFSSLMNQNEKQLIDMLRSQKYKQISISIKDGSITHFKSTKNEKQLEDTINKMSRMIKKGEYKHIEILAVDGTIVKYNEEEMIKI